MSGADGRGAVDVTVVVPVYRNERDLRELYRRLAAALSTVPSWEIVFADDASPDDSAQVLAELADGDPRVRVHTLARNAGQHRAVLAGLRLAAGSRVVVMDADLQDPPEAVRLLLDSLERSGAGFVFAGRRGEYESRGRLRTSRAFKTALGHVTGLPADAGMFFAAEREAAVALLAFRTERPFIPAMIGLLGLPVASVPVERAARSSGASAYTGQLRLRVGVTALASALWWRATGRGRGARDRLAAHNERQLVYYGGVEHDNLRPRESAYLERHARAVLEAACVGTGGSILEVGCGQGRYTVLLAGRVGRLDAMDLSSELLSRLAPRARELGVSLHHADVTAPPPAIDGTFDAVVGFFALHHIEDLPGAATGIARMLRPGGRAVFLEPNPYDPAYYVQMLVTPDMTFAGDKGILRMRRRVLRKALEDAGLVGFSAERFGSLPPALYDTPAGQALERALEAIPFLDPVRAFTLVSARLP